MADGPSIVFEPFPGRHTLEVETSTRVQAYLRAYEHLAKFGLGIFAASDPPGDGEPLGFTQAEIATVRKTETPIRTDVMSGIRIEKIIHSG